MHDLVRQLYQQPIQQPQIISVGHQPTAPIQSAFPQYTVQPASHTDYRYTNPSLQTSLRSNQMYMYTANNPTYHTRY